MSESALKNTFTSRGVELRFPEARKSLLSRFSGKAAASKSFEHLSDSDRDLLFAIADLRAWEGTHEGDVKITDELVQLSHDAVASLKSSAAAALGLPDDVHLTLRTDVTGTLGSPDFRLQYEWVNAGRRETPKRVGAFLSTAAGDRRIPLWMKRALDIADDFDSQAPLDEHWKVLAEFRRALEPDEDISNGVPENHAMAGLAMTSFLRGLEVRIANRFSISPDKSLGQFEVLPYSSKNLDQQGIHDGEISEADAELSGEELAAFQYRLHTRGARSAYQLGNNSYLVVDQSSAPILEEMVRVQKSDREERKAFIKNPRAFITEAVNRHLSLSGALEELDDAGQEELVEAIAGPAFIESQEYSDRVTGKIIWTVPLKDYESSGTTWLPEVFSETVAAAVAKMPVSELEVLRDQMIEAIKSGSDTPVKISGENVEVTKERLASVEAALKACLDAEAVEQLESVDKSTISEDISGPIILETLDNFESLSWHADLQPRCSNTEMAVPEEINTSLHDHQKDCFKWALKAWHSGLPGILNADEQGLGKTLQTITFLTWLKNHMKDSDVKERGPVLIVAPTTLLVNWEEEVERHVKKRKFGNLVRLYGGAISGHKMAGTKGTETKSGLPVLDFDWLDEAFEEGRAHRYWFLTTYTTLANYQHSLGKVRFSTIVLDEIQTIKNMNTLASKAVEAMNADFRIGLTGTPIENTTLDLWTIMDRLAPGALGAGSDFHQTYREPNEQNMAELHARVFKSQGQYPPLGLRRLKDEVAKDLPSKTRFLHPRIMPDFQAKTYDEAHRKLAEGGAGAALKMLHHIRSVSVHPGLSAASGPAEFIQMSARLSAVVDILEKIAKAGERALVFIEHREMQFRFAELAKYLFGLEKVDIINGDTPIPKRQAIVNRFQEHLDTDGGFDLLVLGPKSAGTGLTLTAATHVIHLSRWWNPAVEEQCNDRIHRIGQKHSVQVHVPMAIHPGYQEHSFDCLLNSLMQKKRRMADQALWPMGDTKADAEALQSELRLEMRAEAGDTIAKTMKVIFRRDGISDMSRESDGSYQLP
jgi:superfamily II DNA or RNA helicase